MATNYWLEPTEGGGWRLGSHDTGAIREADTLEHLALCIVADHTTDGTCPEARMLRFLATDAQTNFELVRELEDAGIYPTRVGDSSAD